MYIPAIYFFSGPSMALVLNCAPSNMRSIFTAWSGLVGNVFNLIVATQAVGFMSDWFARGHATDAASLRLALLVLAPTGFWAAWHYVLAARTVVEDEQSSTAGTRRHPRRSGSRRGRGNRPRQRRSLKHHLPALSFAAILASQAHADGMRVLNDDAHFPEGPAWYHGKLYAWSMTAIR